MTNTALLVRQIKQSFHEYMDGITAQSLRDKGYQHMLVWGVAHHHLVDIAKQFAPDYSLATALWQCNVRECKLLATLLMPPDELSLATAQQWIDQADNIELIERLVFNLLQHCPFALTLAVNNLSAPRPLSCLAGLTILNRLLINNPALALPTQLIIPAAQHALATHHPALARAAYNLLLRLNIPIP